MRDTIEMAEEAKAIPYWHLSRLKAFETLVRADEREACAKVCDSWTLRDSLAAEMADEIRARGSK
jgi:hypothetical protein